MIGPLGDAILAIDTRDPNRLDQVVSSLLLALPFLLGSKLLGIYTWEAVDVDATSLEAAGYCASRCFDDSSFWAYLLVVLSAFPFARLFRRRLNECDCRNRPRTIYEPASVYGLFAALGSVYLIKAFAEKATVFASLRETSHLKHGDMFVASQAIEGLIHLTLALVISHVFVCWQITFWPFKVAAFVISARFAFMILILGAGAFLLSRFFGYAADTLLSRGTLWLLIVAATLCGVVAWHLFERGWRWFHAGYNIAKRGQIRETAYGLFRARQNAGVSGTALEDWLEAERQTEKRL